MSDASTSSPGKQAVRAGIVVDGLKQQAWVEEAIRDLIDSGALELHLIALCSGGASRSPHTSGLLRAYADWDKRTFQPALDALAETDVSWMLDGAQRVEVCLQQTNGEWILGPAATGAISEAHLDVVVSFLSECPVDLAECGGAYGNWFFGIGGRSRYPALKEVFSNQPITPAQLFSAVSKTRHKLICRCNGSTEPDSWRLNLSTSSWRLGDLLKRGIARVHQYGVDGLELDNTDDCDDALDAGVGAFPLLSVARLVGSRLRASLDYRLFRDDWFCAIKHLSKDQNPLDCLKELTPLKPSGDLFWADPFPIAAEQNGCYLFVEEAEHSNRRGHISLLQLDKDGRCVDHSVIIERPFHMSYPFVFQYEGEFYMVPQSSNKGQVEVFRCFDFPTKWEYHSTILRGEKFSDTSLIEHNGKWWLFTTPGTQEILPLDDLMVFHAETPFGPWLPHKRNPVISDARYARPAGRPFIQDGKLLRPAQDCSYREYGRAITIREIVTLTDDEFVERDYMRIDPNWMPGLSRTHTFNFTEDLLVLDGCRKSWRR